MKNYIGLLVLSVMLLSGCTTLMDTFKSSETKSQDKLDKKTSELQADKDNLSKNNTVKLKQIGTVSKGIQHALNKDTNNTPPVNVARELNDRVISLAGNPDVKDVVRVKQIVDDLISEVELERKKGKLELTRLDKELQYSQSQRDIIQRSFDKKSDEYRKLSEKIAEVSDQQEAAVEQMDKWLGLGAVFYGMKKFLISSIWILSIGTVLFMSLRILSQTNPIAASVFGIFELVGSGLLHAIKAILPNSFGHAKFTDTATTEKYRTALDKLIDTLQSLKEQNKVLPAESKIDLDITFSELDKKMDNAEKKVVSDRLIALGWKI
jgi:DNA integrity scanning protein DisA with diadenylate cyclase activity